MERSNEKKSTKQQSNHNLSSQPVSATEFNRETGDIEYSSNERR